MTVQIVAPRGCLQYAHKLLVHSHLWTQIMCQNRYPNKHPKQHKKILCVLYISDIPSNRKRTQVCSSYYLFTHISQQRNMKNVNKAEFNTWLLSHLDRIILFSPHRSEIKNKCSLFIYIPPIHPQQPNMKKGK